jgi:elongation factor 2
MGHHFVDGTPMSTVRAYLPENKSTDFTKHLHRKTGGQAFAHFRFDHSEVMPGDPLDPGTKPFAIIQVCKQQFIKCSIVKTTEKLHYKV